jgi:hypothetical protein
MNNETNTERETKMKTIFTTVTTALTLACALNISAGDTPQQQKLPPASAEFERLKALVGKWQGKVDIGQGPIDMTVQYRVLAGGTVVEERCFIDTPNEMVTMFYDKNGKLALTHYCMMGNRPGMVFASADDKTINFAFDENCGINAQKESHMHALSLRFDDANTITTSCKAIVNGQTMAEHPTTLKRIN